MKPFEYTRLERPEALSSIGIGRFLAGGTNLIDLMKHEIETPEHLIDVSRAGMKEIRRTDDGSLSVGAQVTNTELAANDLIRQNYPVLSQALLSGATQQLRNKATTGGNLLQRTRCPYFYDTARACNKRQPGSGCDAMDGLNRMHAILGTSDQCIAVHPSDMAVAMAALDARIRTRLPEGDGRVMALEDLLRLPGDQPELDHTLEEGELIVAVELPGKPPSRQAYRKARDRSSYAFAVLSAAVAVDFRDGRLARPRIALGGVAHRPWRAKRAEAALEGAVPSMEAFMDAMADEMRDAQGHGHNDFKIKLAPRIVSGLLRDLVLDNAEGEA